MKELDEYREKLINRLTEAAKEFRSACLAVKQPYEPIEPGGWNVHQLAVHTRDVDRLVYGERARRTLAEDNPLFPSFYGDRYMAEHYDPHEPLGQVLDGLVASVQALAQSLREMPLEGWSRPSRHETMGNDFPLQTWVERDLEHIEEHLATVRQAKRSGQ